MYNKLFTKILDSSIWLAPDATRIVWITMIAAMDEDGFVQFATPANVAAGARVSNESAEKALAELEAPEPSTANFEDDGRRIERVPGGWMVLNAPKYRDMVLRVAIREQTRQRVARHRAEKKGSVGNAPVTPVYGFVTQSRADQKQHQKQEQQHLKKTPLPPLGGNGLLFEKFWKAYPSKVGKIAAQKAFEKHNPDGSLLDAMLSALEAQRRSDKWQKDGGAFVPNPATWLNQGRWLDVVEVEVQPLVGAHPLAPVSERKPETDEQRRKRLEIAGFKR